MNFENIKKYSYYFAIILILIAGFSVRLKLLLDNPSFWFDESCLGFNAVSLKFSQFFGVLHLQQVAPPMFLVCSKLITTFLGTSDLTLRLFPFIVGNITMLAFLLALKQEFKNKWTIILGLFLFCFNVQAIKFSVEFKPYICELFSACIILYIFHKINIKSSYKKLLLLGITIAILPWFAFASAGLVLVALVLKIKKDSIKQWWILTAPFIISLCALGMYYLKVRQVYNGFMTDFFIKSFFNLKEFPLQFMVGFNYLFNISLATIPFILFLSGLIYCLKTKKHLFLLKFTLFIFAGFIFCSFAKIYPFYDRFVLFLLPFTLLIILSGINSVFETKKWYAILPIILILIPLINPEIYFAKVSTTHKFNKDSCARQLFQAMSEKQNSKDVIVVNTLSSPDFLYYNTYHNLKNKLYMNIQKKEGVIQYSTMRNEPMPLNNDFNTWVYLSWPSEDYSHILDKTSYKDICSLNKGAILYLKRNK